MRPNAGCLLWILLAGNVSASPRETALSWLERHEARVIEAAERLWAMPEPAHAESRTSAYLVDQLASAGFAIERGVAGLPTAFVASYGAGRPVIGIIALLDALPGLSQQKLATERKPRKPGGAGHGCGHNLIAAADLGAALALKEAIATHGLEGSIRYYGAPAEEIYHGGVYMARAGVFDDADALLFWHPSSVTAVMTRSGLAMDSLRFVFHGRPSDATDAAPKGLDALGAVDALRDAAERERRTWPEDVVLNHVIVEGGTIPSIVSERATLWYFLHARNRSAVDALRARLGELAEAAARATGTRVEMQVLSSTRRWLINRHLAELIGDALTKENAPVYSDDERSLAQALRAPFASESEDPFFTQSLPLEFSEEPAPISDDTAEASWIAPRGGFLVACFPSGVPSHTWQWTASAASSFAHKGMLRAARALVRSATALLTDPEALRAVRRELEDATGGTPYVSPLPAGRGPFDYLERPRP